MTFYFYQLNPHSHWFRGQPPAQSRASANAYDSCLQGVVCDQIFGFVICKRRRCNRLWLVPVGVPSASGRRLCSAYSSGNRERDQESSSWTLSSHRSAHKAEGILKRNDDWNCSTDKANLLLPISSDDELIEFRCPGRIIGPTIATWKNIKKMVDIKVRARPSTF